MKNLFRKIRLVLFALVFIPGVAAAIPGIKPVVPDVSGQFIYYRDYTFENEDAYVGFLQYDEKNYALRFVSTEKNCGGVLSDILLYVTVDPNIDYINLTGEKIASTVTAADTDNMNLLHDMLYELAGRRKKMNDADFSKSVTSTEEFVQFGGTVILTYRYYIPLFNLLKITDDKGNIVFEAVTAGKLSSSADSSFSDFKGIPAFSFNSEKKTKKNKKSEPKWEQETDFLWACGNDAILVAQQFMMNTDAFKAQAFTPFQFYAVKFLCGTSGAYVNLQHMDISADENRLFVSAPIYEPVSKKYNFSAKEITILSKNDSLYNFSELTCTPDFYRTNKDYLKVLLGKGAPMKTPSDPR